MLDLSGTVHVDDKLIPGVKDAISLLNSHGVPLQFVSNTSKENINSLTDKIRNAGLNVEEDSIFTSLTAARDLGEKKLSKTCIQFYILVKKEGLRPLLLLEDSAAEEFSGIDLTNPNCVLVGLAPSQFQYDKLNQAFKLGTLIIVII